MVYSTFTSRVIQLVSNLEPLHPREMQVQYSSIILPNSSSIYYFFVSDVFCYLCDDMKEDLELASHLSTFGISVQALSKTEKSMTELVGIFSLTVTFSYPLRGLLAGLAVLM